MRILIVGAGGLGTVLAAHLARSGADVSILVKPEHAQQLQGPELRVSGTVEFTAPVSVVTEPAQLEPQDLAIICVKARDTEAALEALRPAAIDTVLSLQNSVGKDELLVQRFGPERVVGAVTYVAGTLERPGHARSTNPAPTFVGELDGRESERTRRLAAAIEVAGLPAASIANIVTAEWYKLAVFLRTALVSALTRLDIAALAARPSLRRVCAAVALEVTAVAAAEGQRIPREALPEFSLAGPPPPGRSPDAIDAGEDEVAATLAALGASLRNLGRTFYPSLAQDIMAGRPSELEATAGDVLTRAGHHGLSLPVLATCTDLLRGLERSRTP